MAYATISDIESRIGRDLSTDEQARASVLLDDAANILNALANVDDADPALLTQVNADMVIRTMTAPTDAYGVSNMSMTAGSYSQSWTYANPGGDLYLTKLEKRLLGISSGYIGSIPVKTGGYYD